MKILFLMACVVAAVALSMLSLSMATGRVPFHVTQADVPATHAPSSTGGRLPPVTLDTGVEATRIMEGLVAEITKEREQLKAQKELLDQREKEIRRERELVDGLMDEVKKAQQSLEQSLVKTEEEERVNIKRLADVCSKMEADQAATLLMGMTEERAARVINLIGERQAAAIMGAAINKGGDGTGTAVKWAEAIRRLVRQMSGA